MNLHLRIREYEGAHLVGEEQRPVAAVLWQRLCVSAGQFVIGADAVDSDDAET